MPGRPFRSRRDSERREYASLVGERDALEKAIAAARDAARRASGGLDLHKDEPLPRPHGELAQLRDGSKVLVQPIEADDRHQLVMGFRRLGTVSRYERFRGPVDHLTPEQVAYFTQVDHDSHEAFVAADAETGEGVGVARYIRQEDDPRQADFACAVADARQERGVGAILAERLARRARAAGIERFRAELLVGNQRARRLLAHVAYEIGESRYGAWSRSAPACGRRTTRPPDASEGSAGLAPWPEADPRPALNHLPGYRLTG